MPRGNKSPIGFDQAVDWYKRRQRGESVTTIAGKAKCDERTVRKHINRVEEQQETAEARTEVYKEVLREHYQDLMEIVKKLAQDVAEENDISIALAHPLTEALKEHLPKSAIWSMLETWGQGLDEEKRAQGSLRSRVGEAVTGDSVLTTAYEGGRMDVQGMINLVMERLGALPQEGKKLDSSLFNVSQTEPAGCNQVKYAGYLIGVVTEKKMKELRVGIEQIVSLFEDFPGYVDLINAQQTKVSLKKPLSDNLTTIIYRKMVPGRCRYCPF